MPLAVRAKGVSLSTATNWLFNFIVGEGTPVLQDAITWRLYPMHAMFCLCSLVLGKPAFFLDATVVDSNHSLVFFRKSRHIIFRWGNSLLILVYPETKGIPLEEMDVVFGEGDQDLICNLSFEATDNLLESITAADHAESMAFIPRRQDSSGAAVNYPPERKPSEYRNSNLLRSWWDRVRGREPEPDYRPIAEGEGDE
jgi:hypothetical protein